VLIGILGFGSIGMRHGRNLMDIGHQVVFHDPGVLGSIDRDVLIREADAVIICTPTIRHALDLCDVLQARKHVLVEKPIGYDCPPYISGLIMGARSAAKGLVVATGFMCRFHPEVQRAKRQIDAGFFGKIGTCQFDVLQKNSQAQYLRDGVIRNWASHELDLARHLLGNLYVEEVSACTDRNNQDVSMMAVLCGIERENKVYVRADYITAPEIREFEIVGSDAHRRFDLVQGQAVWDKTYVDELKAFIDAKRTPLPPTAGEAENGFRKFMLPQGYLGQHVTGISIGQPPFLVLASLELAREVLLKQREKGDIEIPFPAVTEKTVKLGKTVFPNLADSFFTDFTDSGPNATVVICVQAALSGKACPGTLKVNLPK